MATRILGVDLGSHSVKVLIVQPGFRQVTPLGFIERALPPPAQDEDGGAEGHMARAAQVVAEIAREQGLLGDTVYVAAAGKRLFIHVLELAFRNLRRPDLEIAVGAELEGILPVDLEDMVYGFEGLPDPPGAAAGGTEVGEDEPTAVKAGVGGAPARAGRVAAPTEGMRVLACAMEIDRAREIIDRFERLGLEPRGLLASPMAYARLADAAAGVAGPAFTAGGGAVAVVDVGHEHTEVCVVQGGQPVYARSIARGGRMATEAVARAWRLGPAEAEATKHRLGFVASARYPADSVERERMDAALRPEWTALARELKRTLRSCRAKTGITAERVLLVGGGSRVQGSASFLAEALRLQVDTLGPEHAQAVVGGELAGVPVDVAGVAAGVVMEAATGRPHFDLRQGELAYKADLSFLREKAGAIVAAVVIVMAFAVFNGFAALYQLRKSEAALETRLALETTALFGEPLDVSEAMSRIGGTGAGRSSPLPRMTAYDILLALSDKLPDRDKVTLDVQDLDIRQSKLTFQATAKSSPEIDAIEDALKGIECFKDIARGSTSTGRDDTRQFSFTINMDCM
ncbi:pilus assembly protein PilM [Haliangium sp.]|uniref:pilus assembly protein PilM n=1 Tax=Haliangium sp. TaxID=2663208 RepID=UPI003D14D627